LTLGLLQKKHLTNSDQWEEGHAVIQTRNLDGSVSFPLAVVESDKELNPRCTGHPHSLEYGIILWFLLATFFLQKNIDILL
jgi:hypothetical protein